MGTKTEHYPRLKAMANQVRNNGGEGKQELLGTIHDMEYALMRQIDELRSIRLRAESPACRLAADFVVPEAACQCGAKAVPFAFFDGEDVSVSMHCLNCCEDVAPLDWPFNEERVYWDDFERAGFTVEN